MTYLELYSLLATIGLSVSMLIYGAMTKKIRKGIKLASITFFTGTAFLLYITELYSSMEIVLISAGLSLLIYLSTLGWAKAVGRLEEARNKTILDKNGKVKVIAISLVIFILMLIILTGTFKVEFYRIAGWSFMVSAVAFSISRKYYGIPVENNKDIKEM
jgi:hypothetical protein